MKHIVGVADMKIAAQSGDVIVTHGLGSCLGVAAYDARARTGGLLHLMMPSAATSPEKAQSNPYMFVDTGLPAFFEALEAAGARRRHCRICVAGGALVNANTSDHFAIGKRNYIMLKKILWKNSILVDAQDVGGEVARTMYLEIGTGKTWLHKAGQHIELSREPVDWSDRRVVPRTRQGIRA